MGQAEVELGGDRPGKEFVHAIRALESAWPLLHLCRAKVSPGSNNARADADVRMRMAELVCCHEECTLLICD